MADTTASSAAGRDPHEPATVVHYKVNGELQRTRRGRLTVEQILRRAGTAAGIDVTDLDSYYLDSIKDGREYRNLADEVRLREGDEFLAMYSGATPIA